MDRKIPKTPVPVQSRVSRKVGAIHNRIAGISLRQASDAVKGILGKGSTGEVL
jgi:hypothetical protein